MDTVLILGKYRTLLIATVLRSKPLFPNYPRDALFINNQEKAVKPRSKLELVEQDIKYPPLCLISLEITDRYTDMYSVLQTEISRTLYSLC